MSKILLILMLLPTALIAQFGQFPATLELDTLDGENGFIFKGEVIGDWTGYAVKSAGDFNGDGYSDLLIGADGSEAGDDLGTSIGRVYIIWGHANGSTGVYEVEDLTADRGLVINGNYTFGRLGWSVNGLGDINGDGVDDVIIGEPGYSRNGFSKTGKAYVIFGSTNGFPEGIDLLNLNGANGFSLTGEGIDDERWTGKSVSSAGDINGDGFIDLVISAPQSDTNGMTSGIVYVIYGTDLGFPADIDLESLTASTGFKITGEAAHLTMGFFVRPLGDVNGDGMDDLGVSSSHSVSSSYVLYGRKDNFPGEFLISVIDGNNGFRILGPQTDDHFMFVSGAGDFNLDGKNDILLGFRNSNVAYVLYGRADDFPVNVMTEDLNGSNGFKIMNSSTLTRIGGPGGKTGDVNDDGIDDLFVGTTANNADGVLGYLIFGIENHQGAVIDLSTLNGLNGFKLKDSEQTTFFESRVPVAALEDFNGDGVNDFAIGSEQHDLNGVRTGGAFLVYGKKSDLIFSNGFE